MSLIIIIAIIWSASALIRSAQEKRAREKAQRIAYEQERIKREVREMKQRANEEVAARIALEREQIRQAKEQERLAKEQERQAAQLEKHEEMIRKLEMRMASAESELAFNREQRERLFKLLDIEERERDAAIEGSRTWQAHHKKVISLENQIHTVQKRIDKAHMDKAYCESKMAS